jgi:hypothetical protein
MTVETLERNLEKAYPKCLSSTACLAQFFQNGLRTAPTVEDVTRIAEDGIFRFERGEPSGSEYSAFFIGSELAPASNPFVDVTDAETRQILALLEVDRSQRYLSGDTNWDDVHRVVGHP